MSVKLYDNALIAKIRKWTQNTDITVLGPDETRQLFQIIADKTNDNPIRLPLIAITRNRGYDIVDF